MRLHHIIFGCALICAAFAWAAPMAWDRHALLVVLTLVLTLAGLVLATGSKLLDVVRPERKDRYSRRERIDGRRALDRAFNEGRSLGAVDGPSERTLARWRREGFPEPGARR